ncbi:MAG: PAS domain-containing protein [Maritimibacter sp.]
MTLQPSQEAFRPETGEAPFALDEVFFSRTDPRGVIQAGNEVFRRVAAFDWGEMLNAPHKIIRHPDMPRAVFWLLWDHIQNGKPIAAYVKNKAKDGLYYWVFATIAPCEGGYISARIKPTSEIFALIQQEYAALRKIELEDNISPEDSANLLLARLNKLGFEDYDMFGAQALSQELLGREKGLGRLQTLRLDRFHSMLDAAEVLRTETDALIEVFRAVHTVPMNMQVIASRLEPSGGPVSTLSKNYTEISREMAGWFESNIAQEGSIFGAIQSTVAQSMLLEGMGEILTECDDALQQETLSTHRVDIDKERCILGAQLKAYSSQSKQGLDQVREEATRIQIACKAMHRHVTGLSSTRVLTKIEAGRIQNVGEGLGDIIEQLGNFQDRISERLNIIEMQSEIILSHG